MERLFSRFLFSICPACWAVISPNVYSIPKGDEIKEAGSTQGGGRQQTYSFCQFSIHIVRVFKMLGKMVPQVLFAKTKLLLGVSWPSKSPAHT